MMLAAVEFKEGIQSFELMQDKQHETTSLLVKRTHQYGTYLLLTELEIPTISFGASFFFSNLNINPSWKIKVW